MTSRQGLGVGGGTVAFILKFQTKSSIALQNLYQSAQFSLFTDAFCPLQPYGFDIGQSEKGNVLKGLDLGVEGMRVGGQV